MSDINNATEAFNGSESLMDPGFSTLQRNLFIGISYVDAVENGIGFAGNLIIIIANFKSKFLKSYAHLFILNLAVADCFASLFTPLDITNALWIVADPTDEKQKTFCFVGLIFFLMFIMQNVLSMALIAIDRWISVEFPIFYKAIMTERAVYIQIAISWVLGSIMTATHISMDSQCYLEETGGLPLSGMASMLIILAVTIICYGRIAVIATRVKGRDRLKTKL